SPRLLRCLKRNALPSLHSLLRGLGEMGFGALSDHGNDSTRAQFHTLLDGPLHAVKFENGEQDGQLGGRSGRNNCAELKLDPVIGDAHDTTATDAVPSRAAKFLPDTGAKHSSKMLGVGADQNSPIAGDLVGDPAAAGHANSGHVIVSP